MLPAEMRRKPAQINIPTVVTATGVRPGLYRRAHLVAVDRHPDPLVSGVGHRHQGP